MNPAAEKVLLVLREEGGPVWGFDLSRRTGLHPGTLYPVLARLEAEGQVASGWGTHRYPRRRYYTLKEQEVDDAGERAR